MPNKLIKTKFNSGELSPLIDGGTDLSKYYNGCSKLVNATVLPYGGVVKRSGTEYIGTAKTKCKLIEFEFSANDTVVIEMGELYARFYSNGDRIYEALQTIDSVASDTITQVGHGYSTGDWVFVSAGSTSIDEKVLVVVKVNDNSYTLTDTNGVAEPITGSFGSGSTSKVYEIETPYSSTEVFDIHYTQSADVIYMAHPDHPQQKMSRLGITVPEWTIADVDFTGGPWLPENVTSTTMTYTGDAVRTGYYFAKDTEGVLEASTSTFIEEDDVHIGSYWLIQHTRQDNTDSKSGTGNWAISGDATTSSEILTKGDFTLSCSGFKTTAPNTLVVLERKEGNGDWQEFRTFTAATSFSATELFDDVYFRVEVTDADAKTEVAFTAKEQINNGIVRIDSLDVIDPDTKANVTVISPVGGEASGGASAASVTTWSEGSWSDYRGYPVSVTFFEDRLWWGGTTSNPQTIWGSKIGFYEDHTPGTLADDAVNFTIQDNNMSAIEWIAARRTLVAGTANKEYSVRANNVDDPIGPTDIKASPQSTHGSDGIQPLTLNDALFYVQRSGRKVWAMRFSFADEEYKSTDATLLAEHLLETAPADMAVMGVPDPILWLCRDDGVLLSFTYQPEEEVFAWARHVTGTMSTTLLDDKADPDAMFESVAVVAGEIEDELWVSVQRQINGNTVRYIEKFSTRFFDQLDEAQMMDSAITNLSGQTSGKLVLASDTIRYGSGAYGSGRYGGRV